MHFFIKLVSIKFETDHFIEFKRYKKKSEHKNVEKDVRKDIQNIITKLQNKGEMQTTKPNVITLITDTPV